jgi:hypothetical protein
MNRSLTFAILFSGMDFVTPVKAATDWFIVDTILTRSATVSADVHRYGLPRSGLKVSLDGVALKPAFALGGWLAFMSMGEKAMMMGA